MSGKSVRDVRAQYVLPRWALLARWRARRVMRATAPLIESEWVRERATAQIDYAIATGAARHSGPSVVAEQGLDLAP